jgi:PAS domain S-box-containing protein
VRTEPPTGDPQRELKLICMNNLLATTEVRLYFKDLLSRFILLSSGFIAAYAPGRTVEELIGKTDFDVFSYTHANAARTDEQEIIRTGRPMIGKLERETYKGRADAWVSTTKLPLRDERGKIIGTFGFTRDVTAHIASGQPAGKP